MAFLPAHPARVHAGQPALPALFDRFGRGETIRLEPALDPRLQPGKGIAPDGYRAQLPLRFTSGGGSRADAARLDENTALKALRGLPHFSDQASLGEAPRVPPARWA